jgi:mRNA interferase MazF
VKQGDVYWLTFRGQGSEPDGRRPVLVIQHDRFNNSAIRTTVVAAITSNLRLAHSPGNVRLPRGEAGLFKSSVVNVSLVRTVDRGRLEQHIGRLGPKRLRKVLDGLDLLLGITQA